MEDIAICDVVRAELLHGTVSTKDFANIMAMLEASDEFNFEDSRLADFRG